MKNWNIPSISFSYFSDLSSNSDMIDTLYSGSLVQKGVNFNGFQTKMCIKSAPYLHQTSVNLA